MVVVSTQAYRVDSDADVVRVRRAAQALVTAVGLSPTDQANVVLAVSELARNTRTHGGGGVAILEALAQGRRRGVTARFIDHGPGIPDVELALTDGWSTGSGMGLGLPGTRRLVDEFALDTRVGHGTTVSVTTWAKP